MLWGAAAGGLEVRREGGATRLRGRFPYGRAAVLSDGGRSGRPRKEIIAPRAFAWRVEREEEDIHLLVGHSFDRPLASRSAGTLDLRDGDDALTFEARITPEVADTSHARDALALLLAGLASGVSPGFRMPPERAVPPERAERVEEEPIDPERDMHGAIIRHVLQALLFELSLVTRPAYSEAQVEARCWTPGGVLLPEPPGAGLARALSRWRP